VVLTNQSPRLTLLERLGYLEKKHTYIDVEPEEAPILFYYRCNQKRLEPYLYEYRVLKDIPHEFLYSE